MSVIAAIAEFEAYRAPVAAAAPIVLNLTSQQVQRVAALQTLLALSYVILLHIAGTILTGLRSTLGPRAIPYLKDIVRTSVLCCQEAIDSGSGEHTRIAPLAISH